MTKSPCPKFSISVALPNDLPTIEELICELAEYEKLTNQLDIDSEALAYWLFEKKTAEVLLIKTDIPIGFVLFFYNFSTFLGKSGIYIEDFYIKPEYRNLGIGTKVLKQVAAIAKERNCGRVEWSCLDWNTPSILFYKKMGAIPLDDWTIFRLTKDVINNLSKNIPDE